MSELNKLSPDSRRWLIYALDPNHDEPELPAGYPDDRTENSIVRKVVRQVTIERPSTYSAGANWSLHARTSPILGMRRSKQTAAQAITGTADVFIEPLGPFATGATSTLGGVGPGYLTLTASGAAAGWRNRGWNEGIVTICASPNDAIGTYVDPSLASNDGVQYQTIEMDTEFLASGMHRVIGCALETVNTTAEMYKQGTVVAYRYDAKVDNKCQTLYQLDSYNPVTTNKFYPQFTETRIAYTGPPQNPASAILYQGATTFAAKEGAYSVCKINPKYDTFRPEGCVCTLDTTNIDFEKRLDVSWGDSNMISPAPTAVTNIVSRASPLIIESGCDTVGHYYSGLSDVSTILVKVTLIVETIPYPIQFRSLATMSAMYDAEALEMYKTVCQKLPSGVVSAHNFSGKFWRDVSSILRKTWNVVKQHENSIVRVASAASPAVGTAMQGAIQVGKAVEQSRRPRNRKKKPASKPASAS